MSKKTVIISVVSAAALLIGAFCVGMLFLRDPYFYYYTQIDNSKYTISYKNEKELYEYKLPSYDDKGNGKEIPFKTTRKLRNNAFLKLKYTNFGGVVTWEEIKWNELPEKLQSIFPKPKQ